MAIQATRTPLVNVMVEAAKKAARKLVRDFGEVEQLQVSKKGPADFVTIADRRAEETIRAELARARPRYGFLMEESGAAAGVDTSNTWVVDPLDGTLNFLHGIPHFCISIALERDGDPFAGVVYAPVFDELFWAEKGAGAYFNGRRMRVSARREMSESLFATGIPFLGREGHRPFLAELEGVMAMAAGVRRFGAAALDLAYVAAGRYEGFWEAGLHPWDIAAGIVLVREAGGFVSDADGGAGMMAAGTIVAANDQMHATLLKVLAEARSKGG